MNRAFAIAALALALLPSAAHAQGCALCADSARQASPQTQKALSRAVVVLLLPPVGMMLGFVGLAFHYRNRHERGED